MIKLNNVSKLYLGEFLLKEVTWEMTYGDKIGLIGANGTGKTTQLRIITGDETPDSGNVYVAPGTKLSYLSQEPIVDPEKTLNEEMYSVFDDITSIEADIDILQKEIAVCSEEELLNEKLKKLDRLQTHFDHRDGYTIDSRIGQVLSGLGFSENDRNNLIKTFSGGWQMRISIAKLLLECPDLLLLDEPTNHLDIKAIEWLEDYLTTYKGGYIIVSHDREFLDRAVNRIIVMNGSNVKFYWGNYSKYLEQKESEYEQQLEAYQLQQKMIAKDKQFIERFRASAARSSQAKSRERQLQKVELIKSPSKEKKVKFNFPVSIKSGEEVIKINHLSKAYGDKVIFDDLNLEVKLNDKIAIIGSNGSGKTTLLKMMMGLDKEYSGRIKEGFLVKMMYFNQHQARSLSGSKTVFEELHDNAPSYTNEQVRSTLGRFGIIGDNVFKHLTDLSGGEKARIALSKILMSGANFLIFDEPTNHLDIAAKEALEEAISTFEGTVIVVSHDRKFIDNFSNKVFEINNNNINVYLGNYSSYKYTKSKEQKDIQHIDKKEQKKEKSSKQAVSSFATDKTKKHSPKSLEKKVQKIEKEIEAVEARIIVLEEKLADSNFYMDSPDKFMAFTAELDEKKASLVSMNEKWFDLSAKLEELQGE